VRFGEEMDKLALERPRAKTAEPSWPRAAVSRPHAWPAPWHRAGCTAAAKSHAGSAPPSVPAAP